MWCFSSMQAQNDLLLHHTLICQVPARPDTSYKFVCFACEYHTYVKGNMKQHIFIHTGEKPFACTFCDYSSTQKSALTTHLKLKHKINNNNTTSLSKDKTKISNYALNLSKE